ncbi:pyrroline-5-carboxylate reductase [Bacillus sp. SJS]|uniref:pyrroline-5-carboxylate reductase n=1 Tax=Bacillus sp. SJS TaxID=1423321 RepID=UPI0004DD2151|nr:pyrroline-5-carboxylate reductase [Bacillus sp. SJS]
MEKPTILFIGAGRMAEAIIAGLRAKKENEIERIIVSNQSNIMRLERLKKQYGAETVFQWKEKIHEADTVVLAMPPEEHEEVFMKLRSLVSGQLIVTIAAGIGPSKMESALPESAVSWIMPNTASSIGESMSLYCKGKKPLNALQEKSLKLLLDAIGQAEECTEEEIHHLTAITGSAPAFVYLFAEVLIEKAKEYGISESKAEKLVTQMISGSAAMLMANGNPSALREQVTTPGGSTAEGIKVLEERKYKEMIQDAITAVNRKSLS